MTDQELSDVMTLPAGGATQPAAHGKVAVLWIDWYAYHLARLRALTEHPALAGRVEGFELVGGIGVHGGLRFRADERAGLPIQTLLPEANWADAGQFRLARRVWQALNKLNPASVLVPGYYTLPGLASALWGRWNRRQTILMTESTQHDHARTGWKERLKSLLLRSLFDWAVAGGEPHVRYLLALDFPADQIARYYDVIDNDFFRQQADHLRRVADRREWGLPAQYFLYVGRLAAEKNVEGLLEAYASYRRQGGTWPLVLVGDGPLRQTLQAKAHQSGFGSDIYFTGLIDTRDLPPYYAFAGCFVLPSQREPWGLVVNEAMASGLPVIVSERCGCVEDLVREGENGYLFDPQQPAQLAGLLRDFSALPEAKRAAMSRNALQRIANYSPSQWADEVARIVADRDTSGGRA